MPARIKIPAIPEFGKTLSELARIIHVKVPTVRAALSGPGAPLETPKKGWRVEEVMAAIKKKAAPGHSHRSDQGSEDLVELRKRQLRAQIDKIEQDVAISRNKYLSRDVWRSQVAEIVASFDQSFQKTLDQELPSQLEGLPAIEIRDRLRKAYNDLKEDFHAQLDATSGE